MSRFTRLCRAVGVGIAVTTATLAMTQVANAQLPPPKIQPDQAAIQAPPANVVFLVGHATGVQTYTCNGAGNWGTSSVPTATLVSDSGQVIEHTKGPTWTAKPDGSAVSLLPGKTPIKANSPDPVHDIPWLLVPVGPAPTSSANPGVLTGTTFVQRVNTGGGVAPPADQCTTANTTKDVHYTADYYFWRPAGKPSNPGKPGA